MRLMSIVAPARVELLDALESIGVERAGSVARAVELQSNCSPRTPKHHV